MIPTFTKNYPPEVYSTNLNSEVDETFEEFFGSVSICLPKSVWLICPTENNNGDIYAMGDYPELFMNKGSEILCLEVNVRSSECENWCGLGSSVLHLNGRFPGYLPIDCFFGKKEGEEVKIFSKEKGDSFTFLCEQRNEPFEETLEKGFMVAYNDLFNKYSSGNLSEAERKRWDIISRMKRKFYPNSM